MANESAWTPGPWTSDGILIWKANSVIAQADIGDVDHIEEEREANARLIAAAPELYEALAWMAGLFNEATTEGVFSDALTHAHAALAKARGTA